MNAKSTNKKRRNILIAVLIPVALILAFIVGGIVCNNALELNTYTITSPDLPESFDGYKIAQVSDLHNCTIGADNSKLVNMLKEASPDIIVLTGDIIDCRTPDVKTALDFVAEATEIAPCYYVTGNHEKRVPEELEDLLEGLYGLGVNILRNETAEITQNGETIYLLGVDDPHFTTHETYESEEVVTNRVLSELVPEDSSAFTVLLAHRPDLFEFYAEHNIDLTFSGHAHGGQIRLPFVGGLYAPDQGLFPKYDGGLYTSGTSSLIVSRGVGNSLFPLRIFNPPEVILVELQSE